MHRKLFADIFVIQKRTHKKTTATKKKTYQNKKYPTTKTKYKKTKIKNQTKQQNIEKKNKGNKETYK